MQMLIHEGLGDEDLMMRDAISMHSEDISGHQRSSAAMSGHQRTSAAISGHQRPSEDISGHQRPSDDLAIMLGGVVD